MTQITAAFLCLAMVTLDGCRTDAPKTATPASQPVQQTTPSQQQHTAADCDAIKDPGQAEDCRFLQKVEAAKKRNKSDNVVKHSPGSIQQP